MKNAAALAETAKSQHTALPGETLAATKVARIAMGVLALKDDSKVGTGTLPHAMASPRNLAINVFRQDGQTNITTALRHTDRDYHRPPPALDLTRPTQADLDHTMTLARRSSAGFPDSQMFHDGADVGVGTYVVPSPTRLIALTPDPQGGSEIPVLLALEPGRDLVWNTSPSALSASVKPPPP